MGHGSQYKVYIQENELGVELQKATDKSTFFMLFHVPFYSRSYSWVDWLVAWSLRTELMVVNGIGWTC
jgi:hypothetical protein